MVLAFIWADVGWAQDDKAIEDELLQDTCLSYLTGLYYYNLGDKEFTEPSHDIASKMYFEMAVRNFEQHEKKHPQHEYTTLFLGQSYYFLTLLESNIIRVYPEYNTKVHKYAQKALHYLPQSYTAMRFICYTISGLCYFNEQNNCDAYNAFSQALSYNLDFSSNLSLLEFYKEALYYRSFLLFNSYIQSIPDTISVYGNQKNIPEWATCMGDQQFDRCFDDLNRLINLEQEESDKTQIDTLVLILLGECHFIKGEYEKATDCYEKSGVNPEQLVLLNGPLSISYFMNSYVKQGKGTSKQFENLWKTGAEYWYEHYRFLYMDQACYKNKEGVMLLYAQNTMAYYLAKGEYAKGLDFWFKIKNNFSFDGTLRCYQGWCRYFLDDVTSAQEDLGFAADLNPKDRLAHFGVLMSNLNNGIFLSSPPMGDTINSIDTLYYLLGGLSSYNEKDYESAKRYYLNMDKLNPNLDNTFMLAMCYQMLAERENKTEQRDRFEASAEKYFRKVIAEESATGEFSNSPYAYIYIHEPDKAIEVIERILQTNLISTDDSLACWGIHHQAAEVYTKVGELKNRKSYVKKAKRHLKKALEYCHSPMILACTEKAPLLTPIHDYVENEVAKYRKQQDLVESSVYRETIVCDIPYKKNGLSNTRTIDSCYINDSLVSNMLFDPGADYVKLTKKEAKRIGITENDYIGWTPLESAFGKLEYKPLVSLDKFQIGDITLENVQAIIDESSNARLLIGCTVWNNLTVEMPANKMIIRLTYVKESIEIPEDKKE